MRSRLLFNALQEQPRALRHAPLTNIQKSLQRIFAMLYFVRSFFDYLFFQRFTWRGFFVYFLQRFILRSFFKRFISTLTKYFLYLIKMTI